MSYQRPVVSSVTFKMTEKWAKKDGNMMKFFPPRGSKRRKEESMSFGIFLSIRFVEGRGGIHRNASAQGSKASEKNVNNAPYHSME